ncbi:hypothetical protein T02_8849 [Trichinella nativa]|uniref:Uncharacterized protein n=1 Tax=Trichinella nativa TaxID=6335 RepID=A0A0V1LDN9_9BILA|nr:hypothetical protein T02_8849 [Trichinella nativa]
MLALTRQSLRACRRADFCLKSLQGSVQKYKQSPLKVLIPRRNMLKAERTVLRFYLFRNTEYIGKWHQKYRMYRRAFITIIYIGRNQPELNKSCALEIYKTLKTTGIYSH